MNNGEGDGSAAPAGAVSVDRTGRVEIPAPGVGDDGGGHNGLDQSSTRPTGSDVDLEDL